MKTKNHLTRICIITLFIFTSLITKAQQHSGQAALPVTYILPGGRTIKADKLDSIYNVWGAGRVVMKHNDDDYRKGIIHLEKLTDQMIREMEITQDAQRNGLDSLIGHRVNNFKMRDMAGHEKMLSDLKGKVVIVNFWFTTCPPCIEEIPELNKMVRTFYGKDVVFLAITFNDLKDVTNFLKVHQFSYQIIPNGKQITSLFGIHNYPTHLIIGKDGSLKKWFLSGRDISHLLKESINNELSGHGYI